MKKKDFPAVNFKITHSLLYQAVLELECYQIDHMIGTIGLDLARST